MSKKTVNGKYGDDLRGAEHMFMLEDTENPKNRLLGQYKTLLKIVQKENSNSMSKEYRDFIKKNKYGSGNAEVGLKYFETKYLEITEIAKLIRKDAKELSQSLWLPKTTKIAVRTSKYAGGQSISVTIELKEKLPRYVTHIITKSFNDIVDQYNYDFSHVMTDYFSSRFIGIVQVFEGR
jgi:hypothetical protein